MANHQVDTVVIIFANSQQQEIEQVAKELEEIPPPYRGSYTQLSLVGAEAFVFAATNHSNFDENFEADILLSRFIQSGDHNGAASFVMRVKNKVSILNALASADFWGSILGLKPEVAGGASFA